MYAMIAFLAVLVLIAVLEYKDYKENIDSYIYYRNGYNDCLLDIDEILADWIDKDVKSVGIETIRNRIAEEYMEELK